MSVEPDLQFRLLKEAETEQLAALIANLSGETPPYREAFGLAEAAVSEAEVERWGLFVRGTLCGAVWLKRIPGDGGEVRGMLLADGWRKTGLSEWMLGELAKSIGISGNGRLYAVLNGVGEIMGEVMTDAGFQGPSPDDETYPNGEWRYFPRR